MPNPTFSNPRTQLKSKTTGHTFWNPRSETSTANETKIPAENLSFWYPRKYTLDNVVWSGEAHWIQQDPSVEVKYKWK